MSRGLVGAGLGAAGATVYLQPEWAKEWAKDVIFGPSRALSGSGTSVAIGKELEQLQRLVEDLSRQVATSKSQPVTVVHTGGGDRTAAYLLYSTAGLGLGVVLYFRVLKGWTFGDMLYATRRGLRDGLAQVHAGLEQLSGRLAEVRAKLQERIAQVMHRQDQMLDAQAEMQHKLAGVGKDVEHTRGQVGQIHAVVIDLEASMAEVGANQRHANHGIYVLCKAVSELMAGASAAIPSQSELIEYTRQHPVWGGGGARAGAGAGAGAAGLVEEAPRVQGLESLLASGAGGGGAAAGGMRRVASLGNARSDENASPERRSPFLLPGGGSKPTGDASNDSSTAGSGGYQPPTYPSSVVYPPAVHVGGAGAATASSAYAW